MHLLNSNVNIRHTRMTSLTLFLRGCSLPSLLRPMLPSVGGFAIFSDFIRMLGFFQTDYCDYSSSPLILLFLHPGFLVFFFFFFFFFCVVVVCLFQS